MVYLLDSNVLIYANRKSYPINGGEFFWQWILDMAVCGVVSLPVEMYFEISRGDDALKHWISGPEIKECLVFDEVISQERVAEVLRRGYAAD